MLLFVDPVLNWLQTNLEMMEGHVIKTVNAAGKWPPAQGAGGWAAGLQNTTKGHLRYKALRNTGDTASLSARHPFDLTLSRCIVSDTGT